jgi:acetone carboxylase gamma subunit
MTLVCPSCQLQMRPKDTGVAVETMADFGSYQVHMADLYVCPDCEHEVLAGFGAHPIAEHFQPDYVRQTQDVPYRFWSTKREKFQAEEGSKG